MEFIMKNLRVSLKLIISFMIVLVLAIAVGVIGMVGMNSINVADDKLYNENLLAISAMGKIREAMQDQRVQLRNMVVHAEDPAAIQNDQNTIAALDREIASLFATYDRTIDDPSEEAAYYNARALYEGDFISLLDWSNLDPRAEYENVTFVDGVLSFELTQVPEPGTWALILGGLGVLGYIQRARRRSN